MLNFYHSCKISQIYFSVTNNVCIIKIIDEAFKIIKIVYDRQIDNKVIKKNTKLSKLRLYSKKTQNVLCLNFLLCQQQNNI